MHFGWFRLDSTFTKIALNEWDERQIQVPENSGHFVKGIQTHKAEANRNISARNNKLAIGQMGDWSASKY